LKSYDKLINVQTLNIYYIAIINYKALYIAILHWIYKIILTLQNEFGYLYNTFETVVITLP